MRFRLLGKEPLLRKRVRHLEHFDVIEGLFQDQHAVGVAELPRDVVPRIIRIGSANHHLQLRVNLPDTADGLDAVPTGGHANVHKRKRVRMLVLQRPANKVEAFLALQRRVDFERRALRRARGFTEQQRFFAGERGGIGARRRQNLANVLVNRGVVVDDENSVVHAASWMMLLGLAAATGSSRTKIAPSPAPSLRA